MTPEKKDRSLSPEAVQPTKPVLLPDGQPFDCRPGSKAGLILQVLCSSYQKGPITFDALITIAYGERSYFLAKADLSNTLSQLDKRLKRRHWEVVHRRTEDTIL